MEIGNLLDKKFKVISIKVFTKLARIIDEDSENFNREFRPVQFSHSVVYDSLRPHESQHTSPPCPSPTPRVSSNSWPWSQ